jgi:hypothetical protein
MYVRRSKQGAAQTKHVFDNLGAGAEIPEQGKLGTLIGSYPKRCSHSSGPECLRLITVAPTSRVISSPNPAATLSQVVLSQPAGSAVSSFAEPMLDFCCSVAQYFRRRVRVSELHSRARYHPPIGDGRLTDVVGQRALKATQPSGTTHPCDRAAICGQKS